MRILLAEDEKKVASHIHNALREAGFVVDEVHRGDQALDLAGERQYDVLILDIMMPGRDGLSILKMLRDQRNPVPVLLLTARGEVSERVEGLMLGADDYLGKPFAMDELIARVHTLTRRVSRELVTMLNVHDLSLNLLTRDVTRAGGRIDLAPREFSLLECLMRSKGRVLSRTHLIEKVWDFHFDTGTNVVDVYVQRLRRKIDDGHEVKLLHTVRGVGYLLKTPA
ncbi:MAG TPA: response regulator transcription factor [Chthoniobacter sp.]|jgi:DNA-binding response OmpR family regulator